MPAAASNPFSALLAFWAEAGVDCAYLDAPADRLAEGRRRLNPRPVEAAAAPPRPAPPAATPAAPSNDGTALIAHAREAAAGAGDLASLRTALEAFAWGPLKPRTAQPIFARGPADARVMLIGEAPGAEDDERREPFAGASGRLLDRMLAAGGLDGRVFITNTVFWRAGQDRPPSPAEQAVCLPFLERAIALVRPELLVVAGGASAKALLGRSEGILALRGRWTDWTPTQGGPSIPALPMLHPAFLLRRPVAKGQAWADILTLVSRLDRQG